jgi:hypothetical protein
MQEKLAPTQLEDTEVILAAPGEMVVPPVVSESTQAAINADLQSVGLNPNDFVVGNGRINQITGLQQFGFLSDVFKKVKKVVKKAVDVVKKAAPVVLAATIPGVGGAMSKGLAGLTELFKKEAGRTVLSNLFKKQTGQSAIGLVEDYLKGKESDPIRDTALFQQTTDPNTGGIVQTSGGTPDYQLSKQEEEYIIKNFSPVGESGLFRGSDGKNYTPDQVVELTRQSLQQTEQTSSGFFRRDPKDVGSTPQIIKSIGDFFGFGGSSGLEDVYGKSGTPSGIKAIEDTLKGEKTGDSFGGLAALAALYGLAAKKATEKTEGGLTDIRASRRPDLVAQPVFQGFDVGIRPGMAKGGLSPELFELDFRKVGGPTIGIGTGTSDDIPAMLSDGEYVMTADANNGAGGFKISKTTDSITLIPDGKPNREKGAKNLGMLMDMFEDANKRMA